MTQPIGIDLGTTNCCVAWRRDGVTHVLKHEAEMSTFPSVVATKAGRVLTGRDAWTCHEPRFRHAFFKREMGSNRRYAMEDGEVTAVELSAHLLRELKLRAQRALGEDVAAVVTVPAYFNEVEIRNTRRAAELAGLPLLKVLSEPVAAALSYQERHQDRAPTSSILVYDLGGGTFDATVCQRNDSYIRVAGAGLAHTGDLYLGGYDFDRAILMAVQNRVEAQGFRFGGAAAQPSQESWLWHLLTAAERVKKELSRSDTDSLSVDRMYGDRRLELEVPITRRDFESWIGSFIERTLSLCEGALEKAGSAGSPGERAAAAARSLDRVILVGGSSRIPMVKQAVTRWLNERWAVQVPVLVEDPDECVARGAALAAEEVGVGPASDSLVEWVPPLKLNVGAAVNLLFVGGGRVLGPNPEGTTVELLGDGLSLQTQADVGGNFQFEQAVPLTADRTTFQLRLEDAAGGVRTESIVVSRGGLTSGDVPLKIAIKLRVTSGYRMLVPAGTRAGGRADTIVYTTHPKGLIRAPLYQEHRPIGTIEILAPVAPGTPVELGCLYEPGRLNLSISVAGRSHGTHEVNLSPVEMTENVARLQMLFEGHRTRALVLLDELEGATATLLRSELEAIVVDLRLEFENRIAPDPGRVDDRLRRLEDLVVQIESLFDTPDGLRFRLKRLRSFAVKLRATDVLAELEALEARARGADAEAQSTLIRRELNRLAQRLGDLRVEQVTIDDAREEHREVREMLEQLLAQTEIDPATRTVLLQIQQQVEEWAARPPSPKAWWQRLRSLRTEVQSAYNRYILGRDDEGLTSEVVGS